MLTIAWSIQTAKPVEAARASARSPATVAKGCAFVPEPSDGISVSRLPAWLIGSSSNRESAPTRSAAQALAAGRCRTRCGRGGRARPGRSRGSRPDSVRSARAPRAMYSGPMRVRQQVVVPMIADERREQRIELEQRPRKTARTARRAAACLGAGVGRRRRRLAAAGASWSAGGWRGATRAAASVDMARADHTAVQQRHAFGSSRGDEAAIIGVQGVSVRGSRSRPCRRPCRSRSGPRP